MKSLKELQEEHIALLDDAEAIINVAQKESRDLTAAEESELSALTAKDTGLIAVKAKEIEVATARLNERKALALSRQQANAYGNPLATIEDGRKDADIRIFVRTAPLKAYKGEGAEKRALIAGMWLRAVTAGAKRQRDERAEQFCESHGIPLFATQTEGTATAGGYLVPEPLSQAIIDVRAQVGVARRLCDVQPMTSDSLAIPKRTGGLTVYAPGEGNTVTTSDPTWGRVNLIAKTRAVATQISQELQDDALISVVDHATSEMAYALASNEDGELINGDGSGTYFGVQGLLSKIGSAGVSTAATGHDTWPELDATDIANWFGLLPDKYRVRGQLAIVCSSNFYHTALLRLLMAAGGNTIASLQAGDVADAMFMGYPCYFTDKMPRATAAATVSALLINTMQAAIIGDRVGVRMGMSAEFAFLDRVLTLLADVRYDINVHEPGDSSNAGAYVALKTAS